MPIQIKRLYPTVLNPSGTNMRNDFIVPGALLGCDLEGTGAARGLGVSGFEVGELFCGTTYNINVERDYGMAFGEYNILTRGCWSGCQAAWRHRLGALTAGWVTAGEAYSTVSPGDRPGVTSMPRHGSSV